jgi:hypothetical protein
MDREPCVTVSGSGADQSLKFFCGSRGVKRAVCRGEFVANARLIY